MITFILAVCGNVDYVYSFPLSPPSRAAWIEIRQSTIAVLSGSTSLALDLMEELRPCMADRFVLTCINNRMFDRNDFDFRESGAVLLKDDSRRRFYRAWQERKKDELKHPYLGEKLQWGMIPYVQALLLARYLRGDLDAYPPFLWK